MCACESCHHTFDRPNLRFIACLIVFIFALCSSTATSYAALPPPFSCVSLTLTVSFVCIVCLSVCLSVRRAHVRLRHCDPFILLCSPFGSLGILFAYCLDGSRHVRGLLYIFVNICIYRTAFVDNSHLKYLDFGVLRVSLLGLPGILNVFYSSRTYLPGRGLNRLSPNAEYKKLCFPSYSSHKQ